ncbi:MAG: hypothetical protein QOK44_4984 [Betaproteobacteria bacterium]|nr:hypothetical protein [Betaproteobacteria bacterium]
MRGPLELELPADEDHIAALRDSVVDFSTRGTDLKRVRSLRGTRPGYERRVWTAMADLGWLGILIPEAYGGLGLGVTEAATVAEALAPALIPEPYTAACVLATGAIVYGDNPELQARLLPDIASGKLLPALAWQEYFNQLDPTAVKSVAAASGDAVELSGTKRFVAGATDADGFIVSARGTEGLALYWISNDARGVRLSFELLVDGTWGAAVELSAVRVGAELCVASPGVAHAALVRALDEGTVVAAAELSGIANRTLDMTLDYLRTRKQFGKPIGSFQALQHRAVDCYVQKELAAAVLQHALTTCAASQDPVARSAAASRAKARCGEAALMITREAIQMHGAIAFTDDCDVGLYAKRSMQLSAWLGNGRQHMRRYAETVPVVAAERPRRKTIVPERLERLSADTEWNALPDEDFRILVRGFIEAHYPEHLRYMPRRVRWEEVREWNLKLAHRGWIAPAWPRASGGMGLSAPKQMIYWQELERWGVERAPDQGVRQLGQVLMRYGTDQQKAAYLPKILACEHIWCQGYSEPNAGSDLASLTTSATLHGDAFVINGQKIWTSMAMDSTHIYMLCRTDTTGKKQEGISFFVVDLKTPGITVRPIRNIAGHDEFCEVFFENVRVGGENLIGGINKGWSVAKAVLDLERLDNGSPRRPLTAFNRLVALATKLGLFADARFVETFTQLRLDLEDHATLYGRFADIVKAGGHLGPDASIVKIWGLEAFQRVTEFALESGGAHGASGTVEIDGEKIDLLAPFYLSRLVTIGGGSNEIQRNIVSKYVLRLPG